MELLYGRKYLKESDMEECRVYFKNGCLDFLNNIMEVI